MSSSMIHVFITTRGKLIKNPQPLSLYMATTGNLEDYKKKIYEYKKNCFVNFLSLAILHLVVCFKHINPPKIQIMYTCDILQFFSLIKLLRRCLLLRIYSACYTLSIEVDLYFDDHMKRTYLTCTFKGILTALVHDGAIKF